MTDGDGTALKDTPSDRDNLYLELEKILEKLSEDGDSAQRKLAEDLATLLQVHYDVQGRPQIQDYEVDSEDKYER